jgi:hypothetical protein
MNAGGSGDRISVVVRFSAFFQTGHGAHQTPIERVPGLFPGSKEAEAWR